MKTEQLLVPPDVLLVCLEAPHANRGVIGARDERIDFLNQLDLIYPVSVPIQVAYKLQIIVLWLLLMLYLHILVVNVPELDEAVTTGREQVACLRAGSVWVKDSHVVDAIAVLVICVIVAKHH